MERAFDEGYFPVNLTLGLETGWTLTEIRNLDPLVKRVYLEFIRIRGIREKERIDKMKSDMESRSKTSGSIGSPTPQNISFVSEEEFISKVGGKYDPGRTPT